MQKVNSGTIARAALTASRAPAAHPLLAVLATAVALAGAVIIAVIFVGIPVVHSYIGYVHYAESRQAGGSTP